MKYKLITGKLIIKNFGNTTDYSGETDGHCQIQFKLKKPIVISYPGRKLRLDRVEYSYGGWEWFTFKSTKGVTATLPVPTELYREVYEALSASERGNGKLKDWYFSDDLEKVAYPDLFDKYGCRKPVSKELPHA